MDISKRHRLELPRLPPCRLSYNRLGPEGAKHLAKALNVNASLTKISLAKNQLGEEGTKGICEALKANVTLVELDLSDEYWLGNIGGPAGAKHVAEMLGVNAVLTNLS